MMAIRRFRFALLLALFLAVSVAFAPTASAYRSNVAQVLPDEDGDSPRVGARGAGGPVQGGRAMKKADTDVSASETPFSVIVEKIWLFSKALGIFL